MTEEKRYYRPDEVADLLRVRRQTVYIWIRMGKLKHTHTPGGLIRIPESEVRRVVGDGGQ